MWRMVILAALIAIAGCVSKADNTRALSDEARMPDNRPRTLGLSPFDRAFGRSQIKSDPDDYWR